MYDTMKERRHKVLSAAKRARSASRADQCDRHDKGRWSRRRKTEADLRIFRGETFGALSRELVVTLGKLAEWHDKDLAAIQAGLQSREPDYRDGLIHDLKANEPASISWTPISARMLARCAPWTSPEGPPRRSGLAARSRPSSSLRPSYVRQPEGKGRVERFIRTVMKRLLWLHRFRTVNELNQALREFARAFNNHWINCRIGNQTPAAHRRILLREVA